MDPTAVLERLGLDRKEASLYLALLRSGQATPLELSRQTKIKRPTCYLVLESLQRKGLVTKIGKEHTTHFVAQQPETLRTNTEASLQEITEALPYLQSLFKQAAHKPRVLIYDGSSVLDRAYDNAFSSQGEVLFMSSLGLSQKLFPRTFNRLDQTRFSKYFRVRELVDEGPEGRRYRRQVQRPFRSVRMIPKKFLPFEADIGIFDNTLLISSVKEEYFTVGIESSEIVRAFRTLYELMWAVAKAS